jgi:hypothetical protein
LNARHSIASRNAPLLLFTAAHGSSHGQQLEHRGFMIDMSRMKEADEYYFDLVDQLALFG